MQKMAIFVEGQTEGIFLCRLVEFMTDLEGVKIVRKKASGGRKYKRILIEMEIKSSGEETEYYILIVESGSDHGIISDIRENFNGLSDQNFCCILGLRDVYPDFSRREVKQAREGLRSSIGDLQGVLISLCLSVMEIEAWFLAESSHFKRISKKLTEDRIVDLLGFFPTAKNAPNIDHPSNELSKIYDIAGLFYDKSERIVGRVVDSLDMKKIVEEHVSHNEDLREMIQRIGGFFGN